MTAAFYLARDGRSRATLIAVVLVLGTFGSYVVVPRLQEFTSGRLVERYSDLNSTNRSKIASFDLEIFAAHPVLGIGPGMARGLREEIGAFGAAHTEFTRMLAEHGLLGAGAILALLALAIRVVVGARDQRARGITLALIVWAALFMLINAMRLAAPSFLFGLACGVSYASLPVRPRPSPPPAAAPGRV
jgi:O-antigen ligase